MRPTSTTAALNEQGFAALNAGDTAAATGFFAQAAAGRPADPGGYRERGRARYGLGDYEAALDDLDHALRHDPDDRFALQCRLWCHQQLDLWDEVADDATRWLGYEPDDPWLLLFRGEALRQLDDPDAALADLDRAAAGGMTDARLFEQQARAWLDLGEIDRAAAALTATRTADRATPPAAWTFHNQGHLWERVARPAEALADFTAAVEKEPDEPRHRRCRAAVLFDLGRDAEAWADIDRAEHLDTGADAMAERTLIYPLVRDHFGDVPLESLTVTTRSFPARVAADFQAAVDGQPGAGFAVARFHAARKDDNPVTGFRQVYDRDRRDPVVAVPPSFREIDVGEATPVRAAADGLWLLRAGAEPVCLILYPGHYGTLEVLAATRDTPAGVAAAHALFDHVAGVVARSPTYRGKVLSLENKEMYSGLGLGLLVHKLRPVGRDEVILPRATVDLLDRNVIGFVNQRPRLAALGLPVKKGLLFYGPPGTGKTHTIHYLAGAVPGHTTLLVPADHVRYLSEYVDMARMLQPSLVVLEDVDLIARDRADMRSGEEEAMLNKLLNEMDGLRADAEVVFVLTTNRPEALEAALASRPGRVDQAVEFPLPDRDGRLKLVRLYARGATLADGVAEFTADRTDRVTASFVKELMRRAIQQALVRDADDLRVEARDVEVALDEMLVGGGSLNRKLLGAAARDAGRGDRLGFGGPA